MTRQQSLTLSVTNAIDYFVKFIKLPEGYSTEQIDKLYNALDGIRDAKGKRLIEGHSSVKGIMTIAVDASKLEEIKAGLNEVTGLKWKVDDSFIGFLKPYQTKENNNARNDTGRSSGIRQEVSAQYNDNLRRETAEMVARKIRERLEARTAGKQARSSQARSSQDRPLTQSRPLTQRDVARALEQLGYDGSPYFFDRFTLSHIGSGEGAQAHGLGLYFALSRRTAEEYRERLAGARTYTYNGQSLYELHSELQDELKELTSSDKTLRGERLAKAHLLTSKMLLLGSFLIGRKDAVKVAKTAPKSYQDAYKWLTEEVYPNLKLEKGGKVYTVEIPDDDVLLHEEFSLRS